MTTSPARPRRQPSPPKADLGPPLRTPEGTEWAPNERYPTWQMRTYELPRGRGPERPPSKNLARAARGVH